MPTEKRIRALEAQIPLRCPHCGTVLECHSCHDWKAEAVSYGIDPELLIQAVQNAMVTALTGGIRDAEKAH